MTTITNWESCYDLGWGKIPHPAAFSHPAKFSRNLIERIIDHALEEGWIEPGQIVIDPFGGTALGAFACIQRGLNWTGCELEYHFQHLGQGFDCPGFDKATWRRYHGRAQRVYKGREDWLFCPDCAEAIDRIPEPLQAGGGQMSLFGRAGRVIPSAAAHRFKGNIERWREMFPHLPGRAVLLQGDSRNLAQVVGAGAGCVVSSPPYAGSDPSASHVQGHSRLDPNSPNYRPFAVKSISDGYNDTRIYGSTPGQLAALPPGSPPALVSSPPFAGNTGGRGDASRNGIDAALFDRHSGGMKRGTGSNPANLDHLPMGDIGKTLEFFEEHNISPQDLEQFVGAVVVSSPPYAESVNQSAAANDTEARIERMRQAGIDVTNRANVGGVNGVARQPQTYGSTPGQLGAMKPGTPAVIGSPPFADSVGSDDPAKRGGLYRDPKRAGDVNLTGSYGSTPGQLGAMKPGAVVVSSPPYATGDTASAQSITTRNDKSAEWIKQNCGSAANQGYGSTEGQLAAMKPGEPVQAGCVVGSPPFTGVVLHDGGPAHQQGGDLHSVYGQTPNQLGNESGDTFWAAARAIVLQCAAILPPGAAAIWVVKSYVKDGKRVDFPGQWQALCESCGFETVHIHRAWLVKDRGEQVTLMDGFETGATVTNLVGSKITAEGKPLENKSNKVQRKSFFRRLAEKNGSPSIDWETVLCMKRRAI